MPSRFQIVRIGRFKLITAILGKPHNHLGSSKLLMAIGVALAVGLLVACFSEEPTLEERARSLDNALICPICPGETIDQSQVQIARDMKRIVREKLAAGKSEAQIKDFFVDRYGQKVLASPPASGFNAALWVLPPLGLLLGIGALAWTVRNMRQRNSQAQPASVDAETTDGELASYIAAVDAELGETTDRTSADEEKDPSRNRPGKAQRHQT